MTINYSREIATIKYGSFIWLLLRWKGSVYKASWPIILIYLFCHITVAVSYQLISCETAAGRETKRFFVNLCKYASVLVDSVPVSFGLGFFVNLVVSRWWSQFDLLPTPDSVSTYLSGFVHDSDHPKASDPVILRRTVARYLSLSSVLCFRTFSLSVKRRYPTLDSVVAAGLMTDQELVIYQDIENQYPAFFVPLVWSISLITKSFSTGMISQVRHLDSLVHEVVVYWSKLQDLFLYDYVNVPLVYDQVVTWSVYAYFAALLLSQQFADLDSMLKPNSLPTDDVPVNATTITINQSALLLNMTMTSADDPLNCFPNIPIFAILVILFYTGWLEVAENHLFPFGEDDHDFDTIPLIERNLATSFWMVDRGSFLPKCVLDACDPDALSKSSSSLLDLPVSIQQLGDVPPAAMGYKRNLQPHIPQLPTMIVTDVEGVDSGLLTSAIPELPCPNELRNRRRVDILKGSLANSMSTNLPVDQSLSPSISSSSVFNPRINRVSMAASMLLRPSSQFRRRVRSVSNPDKPEV